MADLIIRFLKFDRVVTVGSLIFGPLVVAALFVGRYLYARAVYSDREPPPPAEE